MIVIGWILVGMIATFVGYVVVAMVQVLFAEGGDSTEDNP